MAIQSDHRTESMTGINLYKNMILTFQLPAMQACIMSVPVKRCWFPKIAKRDNRTSLLKHVLYLKNQENWNGAKYYFVFNSFLMGKTCMSLPSGLMKQHSSLWSWNGFLSQRMRCHGTWVIIMWHFQLAWSKKSSLRYIWHLPMHGDIPRAQWNNGKNASNYLLIICSAMTEYQLLYNQ